MARTVKKNVYERIEDMLEQQKIKEQELENIHQQLQDLYKEKDELEMRLLLQKVKESGLNIDEALSKLNK
jgi:hypothetical protein